MKRKVLTITLAVLLALLLSVGGATGQEPEGDVGPQGDVSIAATVSSRIGFQGRLTEEGSPVNGERDMTFRLYSNSTCSTQVGSDIAVPGVTVTDGLFSVKLGADQGDFNGQGLWLGVDVGNTGANVVCEEILPAPYALSLRPGAEIVGEQIDQDTIHAEARATTGNGAAVYGRSYSSSGAGVVGYATTTSGGALGVYGLSFSTGGTGVYGGASAYSGETYGVYGESYSTDGRGVYGRASATSGGTYGLYGLSNSSSGVGAAGYATATSGGTFGVVGQSNSTDGRGVYGGASATSGTTYGLYGVSNSTEGRGVFGWAMANSGTTYGVYGLSNSTNGRGVFGENDSTLGLGVYGLASATSGYTYGVFGRSDSTLGQGVRGFASATSGETYGVFGQNSSIHGTGVYGHATATSGITIGVDGRNDSTLGFGVTGHATATSGYAAGVSGWSEAPQGVGVFGWASADSGSRHGVEGSVDGGYGLYTDNYLYVGSGCIGCTTAFVAHNTSGDTLRVGDVVAASGVGPVLQGHTSPVLQVRRATAGDASVLGVVYMRGEFYAASGDQPKDSDSVQPVEGDVAPGDYLLVVTSGLAQVRVATGLTPGQRLTVGDTAGLATLAGADAQPGLVFGRVMGAQPDENGLLWAMIDVQ